MAIDPRWRDILVAALNSGKTQVGGAVPGSRLRMLVTRAASSEGLTYPPSDSPGLKFRQFLEYFDDVVAIRTRPGQDFLVAPVGEPSLLVEQPKVADKSLPGIRHDLFEAFTHISDLQPWYDRETDRIEWFEGAENRDLPWVKIPKATRDQARSDREAFLAQVSNADLRDHLGRAMADENFLGAFTSAVHAAGAQVQWHRHRSSLLTERIRQWADASSIPWRDDWLTSSAAGRTAKQVNAQSAQDLLAVIAALDSTDAGKVLVPLDLVAKLLARKHR